MTISTEQTLKTTPSLFKSTFTVSFMTLLSRLMGFARDMVIAHLFGAVAGMDAFFIAFKVPNFMRRLFAEGAFSQAFVPVLSEYQQTRSESEVKQLINRTAGNLGVTLLGITVVAVVAAPLLVNLFAPGFDHGGLRFTLAADMLRVTFPYLLLISLTAMSGAVLNTYGNFVIPSFTPVLLNVSLITAAVFFTPYFDEPVKALAWGVFAAGFVQLIFQLPFLHKKDLLPRPQVVWSDPGVKRILRLMLPALFGVSVSQINLMLDTIFASFLPVGSVSWLYYSDRLMSFPLGVFGVALATVILPHLSRKHASESSDEYSNTIDWALRCALLIGIPASVGLFLLAGPLLATLFQYGEFTGFDVFMARLSLTALGIGLPAFMLIKVLGSGFYGKQDIRTPVAIGMVAMVTNVILNLVLIRPLAHAGLALATSLAAILNSFLLLYELRKRGIYKPLPGWGVFALRLLMANVTMGYLLWFLTEDLTQWLQWDWHHRGSQLGMIVLLCVVVYFFSIRLFGFRFRTLIQRQQG